MRPLPRRSEAGFTLAEAAVTIALVAVTLTVLLQSLQGSTFMAGNTRDQKIARELALMTLGEIEAGMWQEEMDFSRSGNYSEEGHHQFWWELAIGTEAFTDTPEPDDDAPFDNWAYREEQRLDREDETDEDGEEATEPFEKVRIRVTFSEYGDLPSEVTLERWIPWEQVYGEAEEEEEEGIGTGTAAGATTGNNGLDQGGGGG